MRQLAPEAIWIALLVDKFGYHEALDLCSVFTKIVADCDESSDAPPYIRLSSFERISGKLRTRVMQNIGIGAVSKITEALSSLTTIAPDHPLAFLSGTESKFLAIDEKFPYVLRELYDRNSRLAVLSMSIAEWIGIYQGKIKIADHLKPELAKRFEIISDYPNTEASKSAAGMFRAGAPMLFFARPSEDDQAFGDISDWAEVFWIRVAGFGSCIAMQTLEDEPTEGDDPFAVFVIGYCNAIRADLRARLAHWPLKLDSIEAYEVVSAILCRQVSIILDFAKSPASWTPHIAPIILRAIADNFITFAWMIGDAKARSSQFVDDGLGAIKLQIAHYKKALETCTDPEDRARMTIMVENWQAWLDDQRLDQFVDINLGSWSGLNTRKMAEEAGCIDFYNYVYQPFSWVAHSNWAHVSMYNAVHCQNPAHGYHRAPALVDVKFDPHWLYLATKYFCKTLLYFDQANGLEGLPEHGMEYLLENLEEYNEETEES